jgi:hypothetical protein
LKQGRLIEVNVRDIAPAFRETVLVRLSRQTVLSAAINKFIETLRQSTDIKISEHSW